MITLTVNQLLLAEPVLIKIKNDIDTNGADILISAKFDRLFKKLAPEIEDVYEQRSRIVSKFGVETKEDNGETKTTIPNENIDKFNKYWIKLLNSNIEIFNVFKFKLTDLSLNDKYTLNEIRLLSAFIEEEVIEEEPETKSKLNINFDDLDN